MPAQLIGVLEHRKRQLAERSEAGKDWQETGLVFTTKLGGMIEPRNVNRMFATLCVKANVRPIRVHDLRHSCATLLFTMGVERDGTAHFAAQLDYRHNSDLPGGHRDRAA